MSLFERAANLLGYTRLAPDGGQPASPGDGRTEGSERAAAFPSTVLAPHLITFAAARAMLAEHEQGRFTLSAAFARAVMRDADLRGAMNQRLLALVGSDHCIEPAIPGRTAERYARDLGERFRMMVSRGAELDIVRDAIMNGVGCGQIVWWWRDDLEEAIPVLEPWPIDALEQDPYSGLWYVQTRTGRLQITAGDGRWLLYCPWGEREPYFHGALLQVAEWFLRSSDAARAYSRYIELTGNGIIKARVPTGGRGTPEYTNFIASLRNMGRNAIIPLPRSKDAHDSYDLELDALEADLNKIFVEMLRISGGKMRLVVLGQDLTSQNNTVGTNASSSTGMKVNGNVSRADSETWMDCLRAQMLTPWALYRGRPDLAPFAYYDLEEERDAKGEAEASNVAADALGKWQALLKDGATGRVVDLVASAERWGVATLAAPKPEAERAAVRRLVLVSRGYRGRRLAA